jgi:hypothetical protein
MIELRTIPSPFLLELHTERFVDAMLALEQADFEVVAVAGHAARYVLRDARDRSEDAA